MSELLEEYIEISESTEDAKAWAVGLSSLVNEEPLAQAYLGAALALQANNALNPLMKLSYVKKACAQLNEAIDNLPDDAEPRYLRYSIERRIPSFLGMRKHLDDDRAFLLSWLAEEDCEQGILKKLILSELGDEKSESNEEESLE